MEIGRKKMKGWGERDGERGWRLEMREKNGR